jgi:hypothetical protein
MGDAKSMGMQHHKTSTAMAKLPHIQKFKSATTRSQNMECSNFNEAHQK